VGFCVFVKAKEKMIQKNTLEDHIYFLDTLDDILEAPYSIMSKVFGDTPGQGVKVPPFRIEKYPLGMHSMFKFTQH
jgi:hypothetical protein